MIELSGLTKRYGRIMAVDNLNLKVEEGEVFGFIGPNGAGKTTTIRMMGGLIAPTSGSVVINGIDMLKDPEQGKQDIGFIPDRPYLYGKLTGMEFLRFTADLYGMNNNGFFDKAESILKTFSLWDWAGELIDSYSHGMRQRLIMSAALIHDPKVLIVDEPMVGLDPRAIRLVKDMIKRLAREGMTVFVSTHTLEVAQDICHRVGVIHKGKVIATGTTKDLVEQARVDREDLEAVFLRLTEEAS
ncbi:ABC transporter ATP-binding protein [Desulfatibacillum aliphaticivorans]|uniref:ABC transporter ATP-binding protein n=1 Tax=Desulfatibacillum aliphaticivorans TaxID=218208 RepID=UPI000405AE00|nr:ABC transporter ATP-binding protein [Desulfatibacillum aliphaticivorans]